MSIFYLVEVYIYFGLKTFWKNNKILYRQLIKYIYFILTFGAIIGTIILFTFSGLEERLIRGIVMLFIILNLFSKIAILPFIIMNDVRRLGLLTKNKLSKQHNEISRSQFLQKAGLISAAIPLSALTTGAVIGAYNYKIHKHQLAFNDLPLSFNGLKIVQISDIHVGSFYNKEAVEKGVEKIMKLKADVIFFTGDIVNEKATEMDGYYDVFNKISAPMGVYSILGNHDYGDYFNWESEQEKIANFEAVKDIHQKLGWKLLLNETISLSLGEEKIDVIGVENWGRGFHQQGDIKKAYQQSDASFRILLSHDPTHWEEQIIKDYKSINLTLSGHTHGAQMGIETHNFKWSPISLRYSRWAGLYYEGEQLLHINRGFGFLAYPGRIGIWPEITYFELNKSNVS